MLKLSRDPDVVADDVDRLDVQSQGVGEGFDSRVAEGGQPRPQQRGRDVRDDPIDKTGRDERSREGRAALKQHADDVSLGEGFQDRRRIVLGELHGRRRAVEHL